MDAWESYNYDKFTPSILQVASLLSLSHSFASLIDMQFTHNTPPPHTHTATTTRSNPCTLSLIGPFSSLCKSTDVWLMYAVKRLSAVPLTSPPPPRSAHQSLHPCPRTHSDKFVTVRLWNIDIGRGDVGDWGGWRGTDQKVWPKEWEEDNGGQAKFNGLQSRQTSNL